MGTLEWGRLLTRGFDSTLLQRCTLDILCVVGRVQFSSDVYNAAAMPAVPGDLPWFALLHDTVRLRALFSP